MTDELNQRSNPRLQHRFTLTIQWLKRQFMMLLAYLKRFSQHASC